MQRGLSLWGLLLLWVPACGDDTATDAGPEPHAQSANIAATNETQEDADVTLRISGEEVDSHRFSASFDNYWHADFCVPCDLTFTAYDSAGEVLSTVTCTTTHAWDEEGLGQFVNIRPLGAIECGGFSPPSF